MRRGDPCGVLIRGRYECPGYMVRSGDQFECTRCHRVVSL